MDDGEIEVSSNFQASESFLDDLLRNSETCSHTHTCNPPGLDDAAHTHTCYHTHTHTHTRTRTRVIPSGAIFKARGPSGNREAVRKYREKKKAEAAHLEEEAKKLRAMNQVLMGKLQKQAFLEAQVLRLRSLVVGIRGKIDDELGDSNSISLGENVVGDSTNSHLHLA